MRYGRDTFRISAACCVVISAFMGMIVGFVTRQGGEESVYQPRYSTFMCSTR
jgi:hypothetical protein